MANLQKQKRQLAARRAKIAKVYIRAAKREAAEIQRITTQLPEGFTFWDGSYEKQFYAVLLRTGELVKECWPNAGLMNEMGGKCRRFLPPEVAGIKQVIPRGHV